MRHAVTASSINDGVNHRSLQALREQVRSLQQRCLDAEALAGQLQEQAAETRLVSGVSPGAVAAQATTGNSHASAEQVRRSRPGGASRHAIDGASQALCLDSGLQDITRD